MSKTDLNTLLSRLSRAARLGMEEAAQLCVSRSHREVTIEHFLNCLLDQEGNDMRILLNGDPVSYTAVKPALERCFRRFRRVEDARTPVFSPLLAELLEDAWLISTLELGMQQIRSGAILIAMRRDLGRYAAFEYYGVLETLSQEDLLKRFLAEHQGSIEEDQMAAANGLGAAGGSGASSGSQAAQEAATAADQTALQRFGTDFTALARDGKIDPVFCRDDEIRQIIDILGRRRKNNPIAVGEAGVGKTAVVEGLALKISQGDVPDFLKDVQLWGLDMGALQAGASMKGEFEKRLKAVLDEIKASTIPIVLFIDEAHTLIGAGNSPGGSDAANLLKPALARGEIKTIAATTWAEFKKYFEKDAALARRFQLVVLDEPSVDQAVTILRGLRDVYEKSHKVYITDEALEAAASLSARYLSGRQLPDKAIDVLDTAATRVAGSLGQQPARLESLIQEAASIERERNALERDLLIDKLSDEQQERLMTLDARLTEINAQVEPLKLQYETQSGLARDYTAARDAWIGEGQDQEAFKQSAQGLAEAQEASEALVSVEVSAADIAGVISDWTGIPAGAMDQDELVKLTSYTETLQRLIKGQDQSLKLIEERLQLAHLDLTKKTQPMGVFLLVGPSGVGKTETAHQTAIHLFGSTDFMTVINMSEYQEKHSVSRLLGSPPGYVGYGEGGVLTEAIRKKPYSVVLLDEVEKADPEVMNVFYQAFDKGELVDGEGRKIDCKNVVFFLTSNLGSEQIEAWVNAAIKGPEPVEGEEPSEPHIPDIPSAEVMAKSLAPVLNGHFKPALMARMQTLVYMPLTDDIMAQIVAAKVDDFRATLAETHKVDLQVSDDAGAHLQRLCGQSSNGARLVDQVLQKHVMPVISSELLAAALEGSRLTRVEVSHDAEQGLAFACAVTEPEAKAA